MRAEFVVGVDIGGTNVTTGVVPVEGGEPLGFISRPTDAERGGEAIARGISRMVRESVERADLDLDRDILGIGIGSPGPLNRQTGVVLTTPNLKWENFPVRDLIAEPLGLPAALDNDANCAAYGEWWQGAGRGTRYMVGITLGTGVGGGIVLDGKVYHGVSDAAAEIGHMTINYGGRRCGCGNEGCLEAYASGTNIAARAVEGIRAGEPTNLAAFVDGDLDRVTAATVYHAVLAGDRFATAILEETARYLGAGLANIINLLNPELIVIAGGVTRAGNHLLDPLRAEVRRRAFKVAADACRVEYAELGDKAGLVGAAGVFLSEQGLLTPHVPGA